MSIHSLITDDVCSCIYRISTVMITCVQPWILEEILHSLSPSMYKVGLLQINLVQFLCHRILVYCNLECIFVCFQCCVTISICHLIYSLIMFEVTLFENMSHPQPTSTLSCHPDIIFCCFFSSLKISLYYTLHHYWFSCCHFSISRTQGGTVLLTTLTWYKQTTSRFCVP